MHVYDIGEGGKAESMARLARLPWPFTRPFWAFAFSLALWSFPAIWFGVPLPRIFDLIKILLEFVLIS